MDHPEEENHIKKQQDDEEVLARLEETKKSKIALRRNNLNPERPDSAYLRSLDSSIKRNTAVIKKLKQINEEQREGLMDDLRGVNLSKFVSEAVTAICEAKLKSSDIQAAVQICSLLHQRYKEFSPSLTQGLLKVFFPGKSADDDADRNSKAMKKHSTLKLLLELYYVGVIEDSNIFINIIKDLTSVEQLKDRDTTQTDLTLLASFARQGRIFLGLPISGQDEDGLDVTPEQRKSFKKAFNTYYDALADLLQSEHKSLHQMEKENAKLVNAKGELSEDSASSYEKLRKSYDHLYRNISSLAEALDMPEDGTTRLAAGEEASPSGAVKDTTSNRSLSPSPTMSSTSPPHEDLESESSGERHIKEESTSSDRSLSRHNLFMKAISMKRASQKLPPETWKNIRAQNSIISHAMCLYWRPAAVAPSLLKSDEDNVVMKATGPIKNQREHSMCWTHTIGDLISGTSVIYGHQKEYQALSTQYLLTNTSQRQFGNGRMVESTFHSCYECSIGAGLSYVKRHGIPLESSDERKQYDSPIDDCSEPRLLLDNEKRVWIKNVYSFQSLELALRIIRTQPVAADMLCFEGWEDANTIYRGPGLDGKAKFRGFHGVVMVGVELVEGEAVAVCKCSNGSAIGYNGYVKVSLAVMVLFAGLKRTKRNHGGRSYPQKPTHLVYNFYCVDMTCKNKIPIQNDHLKDFKVKSNNDDWIEQPKRERERMDAAESITSKRKRN